MKYDCALCNKGPAIKTIKNGYNTEMGICTFCYMSVEKSIYAERQSSPKESKLKEMNLGISVDTSQLDDAIIKANQLVQMLERADVLAYRVKRDTGVAQPMPPVMDIKVNVEPMEIDEIKEEVENRLKLMMEREFKKFSLSPPPNL